VRLPKKSEYCEEVQAQDSFHPSNYPQGCHKTDQEEFSTPWARDLWDPNWEKYICLATKDCATRNSILQNWTCHSCRKQNTWYKTCSGCNHMYCNWDCGELQMANSGGGADGN
jgi:hypothetical protein